MPLHPHHAQHQHQEAGQAHGTGSPRRTQHKRVLEGAVANTLIVQIERGMVKAKKMLRGGRGSREGQKDDEADDGLGDDEI
jgi:hypothetical protein